VGIIEPHLVDTMLTDPPIPRGAKRLDTNGGRKVGEPPGPRSVGCDGTVAGSWYAASKDKRLRVRL